MTYATDELGAAELGEDGGVPGSGAQVTIDNGTGTLAVSLGASVTVSGSPAPTFTPGAAETSSGNVVSANS